MRCFTQQLQWLKLKSSNCKCRMNVELLEVQAYWAKLRWCLMNTTYTVYSMIIIVSVMHKYLQEEPMTTNKTCIAEDTPQDLEESRWNEPGSPSRTNLPSIRRSYEPQQMTSQVRCHQWCSSDTLSLGQPKAV